MGVVEVSTETSLSCTLPLQQTSFLDWKMPKCGEVHADLCGSVTYVVACEEKHKPVIHGYHCYRPECPECYEWWANREAKGATERIITVHELYGEHGVHIGNCKHVVFSPPQEWAIDMIETLDGFCELRRKTNELAKSIGWMGGCLIFHSHRKRHKDDKTNCEDRNCNREHEWYISPHFHSVGYGYLENGDDVYERTGWIYENLGKRKNIHHTIKYLLTHCGLPYIDETRKSRAVTWFGVIGYNQLKIAKTETELEYPICEECGEPKIKWFMAGDDGHLIPEGDYVKITKVRTYKLKKLPYKQTVVSDDYG